MQMQAMYMSGTTKGSEEDRNGQRQEEVSYRELLFRATLFLPFGRDPLQLWQSRVLGLKH